MNTEICWMKDNCNHIDCGDPNCKRLVKMNYLYDEADIPLVKRYPVNLTITSKNGADEEKYKRLSNIKNNIDGFILNGENLYIYSTNFGNGKTEWMHKLVSSYFDKIWAKTDLRCRVLFIHVPQFLLALKDNISEKSEYIEHIKNNILTCDLVVFDELTTRAGTNFELDHLLSYINSRLDQGKSCFYTSNVPPSELADYVGGRLASRVTNMSECIEFKGGDMRAYGRN